MLLFTSSGSINFLCDMASISKEISLELGWNRLHPVSAGKSCIRESIPSKESVSDLIREIQSETLFSSEVT